MPLTALDPHTALIVIDLQRGIISLPTAHPIAEIVQRVSRLAAAFRQHQLPVVLVNVDGSPPGRTDQGSRLIQRPAGWTQLVPELQAQPSDHLVTKQTPGAFTHTDLEAYLRGLHVTQVVIVGVSTTMGVEATARHARELGFHVTLITDAMTDMSLEAHENSLRHIFPRLAETGTTQALLGLLNKLQM